MNTNFELTRFGIVLVSVPNSFPQINLWKTVLNREANIQGLSLSQKTLQNTNCCFAL